MELEKLKVNKPLTDATDSSNSSIITCVISKETSFVLDNYKVESVNILGISRHGLFESNVLSECR
ncbi:MAG: hypothetical protein H8E11_07640 [Candidatus Cloacimonetes bacterium]|nr:hypothetical protein [Candidatus Cloacimonadota bacterium]